jgi:hypothetical protein
LGRRDGFYPGAHEIWEMFQYFAEQTYFGPEHERYIAAANAHSRQKFFEVDPEIRSPTEAA